MATAFHKHDPAIDRQIRDLLDSEPQWRFVARLRPYDRAHLLAVYLRLIEAGERDPDLLRAALLHDIGKSNGRHRVGLADRTIKVVLKQISVPSWKRISSRPGWLRTGLYLAAHHAELGSKFAASAGASSRTIELIARHEDLHPTGDRLLDALIAADGGGNR